MPGEKASMAGIRFANDLRKIREAKGITLEELYDETKIPRGLLEAFEENGLFDHPMFNRVYLRSFVRTYADVIGISSEIAVQALDEAVEGEYLGGLAETYLGEERVEEAVQTAEEDTIAHEPEVVAEKLVEEAIPPPEPVKERVETPVPPLRRVTTEHPAPTEPTPQTGIRPIERPAYHDRLAHRDLAGEGAQNRTRVWLIGALGVVVLGALSWFIFAGGSNGERTAEENGQMVTATADTAGSQLTSTPAVQLGDTLRATIRAVTDKVQNIKVTVDDDVRRPYWIELNEERTFHFTDRIIIERQLGKIGLTVEGREYPTDVRDEQDRIVITRETLQSFLNDSSRS